MLVVMKAGGDLLVNGFPPALAAEIKALSAEHSFVMVHGGGDIVSDISTRLGHPPRFVMSPRGFRSRYTDKETAEIFTMVMAGKINKEIISALQKAGVQAVGLSGLDGGAVRATRKEQIIVINEQGRKVLMDGGYTGQIENVNDGLLHLLVDHDYMPVISAVAMGEEAEPLNVDGDRMAANVASALKADKLILLTDVDGIVMEGKCVERLSSFEAKELQDKIGPGMSTKIYAAQEAIRGGVVEVIIASGLKEGAIGTALSNNGGTVIR
jgi:acetylglutamate/LysW-gamma-L-alpha-aminoadipate kinase